MRLIQCLILIAVTLSAMSSPTFAGVESADVTMDYVAKKAEERATKPFRSPREDMPEALRADKLDYDNYREIRFRRDHALWGAEKLPFEI